MKPFKGLFKSTISFCVIALWCISAQAAPPEGPPPGLAIAEAAQAKHGHKLLDTEGVVGHGITVDKNGRAAIVVFTERPMMPDIPRFLDDVPVSSRFTGRFYALAPPPCGGPPSERPPECFGDPDPEPDPGIDPTARFDRPVPIGVSTGHPAITAGTIGCRVTDGTNVYALSNNHVYADENQASNGDPVIQPGTFDGGSSPADDIGTLYDFEPIVFSTAVDNLMDAAIALSTTSLVGNATPSDGYGTPASTTISPAVNMNVIKYGRTTGQTTGTISAINATVDVGYDSGVARFVDQIVIVDGSFSDPGDSGSLVVTAGDYQPVGLLFAGSSSVTIATPIDTILSRFGVTIDGEESASPPSPPVSEFSGSPTSGTVSLTVNFTDLSTENPTSWSWDFGDGGTSTAQNPSYTYTVAGTYTVGLTATNADGSDGETKVDYITVTEPTPSPPPGAITLSTSGYKVRGLKKADLTWSGATTNVDVVRDGAVIATTPNDGTYTDNINQRGGGSYTYQVCEASTSTCSNESVVNF